MEYVAHEITGLTSAAVAERMERGERNRHSARPTRTYLQIIWANVFSLYNVILLASFLALFVIRGPGSAIFPAAIVLINMVLGLVQEVRAKRALDRLAALSVHMVTVRRNGEGTVIRVEDVVQDDVIELHPGDPIVADGRILASDSLEIDESQLSGESEYVPKQPGDEVVSGSFCVSGAGLMQAEQIGNRSYVNTLAELARAYKNVRTPLEQTLDALMKVLVALMIVLAPLTLVGGNVRGLPLGDSLENVVNLMSSLVPQGLLVFVAISFAYGVINISRFHALIQRPNAVESMGHITCLCADKTGTLTQNLLSVREVIPVLGAERTIVQRKLASYVLNVSWHNRTVAAISAFIGKPLQEESSKLAEVPFNSERKWSSVTLSSGETLILGAPEVLVMDAFTRAEAEHLSRQGLRVVAFATSRDEPDIAAPRLPSAKDCIALIALQDRLRPHIADTLKQFGEQAIDIKIISGDSSETVRAIAQQAGVGEASLLTGPEVEQMDDRHLCGAVSGTALFARITPQIKSRIVESLAENGPVAMIGDGVNDVPALKRANLAIAMNDGAQIAKDVSDIILLDNDFSTLPRAFFEGRELTQRIYAIAKINLVKVVYLTILFVLAGFAGVPWPANLLQTTWLSLITLTIPAMLIIFRFLPNPHARNGRAEIIQQLLSWGIIGGIAMTLMDIVTLVIWIESLAVSRTMIIGFAGLYNSLVLWDIYGVTPFSPRSFLKSGKSALAGALLGATCAFIPAYLMPQALDFAPMGIRDLALLAACLSLSFAAVRRVAPSQTQNRII